MRTTTIFKFIFTRHFFVFTLLTVLFLTLRMYPVIGGNFPFQYDNAKDSLVMYDMWINKNPVLVGPTTSISGLFYGPAWYYIALPLNVISNFHPYSGVVTVLFFGLVNLGIFYYFAGFLPALFYATSIGIIGTQQNAWTPYMTSLLITPILFLLLQISNNKKLTVRNAGLIGFFTSLLFHVEVAYAIVFTLILLFQLLIFRKKLSFQTIIIGICMFLLTLIPSAVFELKHDFLQTRAVIHFVQNYGQQSNIVQPNQTGFLRVIEIGGYMIGNASQSLSPYTFGNYFGVLVILITILYLKNSKQEVQIIIPTILLGTFFLYLFLPAKSFYFVALGPVWIYCVGKYLEQLKFGHKNYFVLAVILISIISMFQSNLNYKRLAKEESFLYQPKVDAVRKVQTLANNEDFSSYHFVPEVYDYTYQFIFLRESLLGKTLPSEFSYLPDKNDYWITPFPVSNKVATEHFLIVEKPVYQDVQDKWLAEISQKFRVIESNQINDAITVFRVIKK